jgi:hypothetical protein
MNFRLVAIILFFFTFLFSTSTFAFAVPDKDDKNKVKKKSEPPRFELPAEKAAPVHIRRFDKAPTIDGRIDAEEWSNAVVLKDFYQTNPGDNIAPSRQTEFLIAYDEKFLYIAFRAYDDPNQVRATVAKRDDVQNDDNIRIFLDTFNDRRKAYVFVFNPLGIQQDGVRSEGQEGADFSIDILHESKGMLTENGYTVEAAIPFKSIRYEVGKGKLWGIHILRQIKHLNNEINSWMPLLRDKSGFLTQEGHITGIENIAIERTLEIIPSFTVSETGKRLRTKSRSAIGQGALDSGRFVNQPIDVDAGLTMKLGITPTVTLDFALNPDFADVEADAPVVTTNQRFPIFFEEKRPFFLEGKEIFRTDMNVVNTRAIVDPDVAVKLSGRRGRNTFGLMFASDNAPGNYSEEERTDPEVRPSIERFIDKNALVGVLRLKRDVGKENTVGLVATSYDFIEKHNKLVGFDGRFRLNEQTVFSFMVTGTHSRRFFYSPNMDQRVYRNGNGFGYLASIQRASKNFVNNLWIYGRTRDYRADVGFTRRVNLNSIENFNRYRTDDKPKAKVINFGLNNFNRFQYDWQGRIVNWNSGAWFVANFPRETFLVIGAERIYERVFEEEFGPTRAATRLGAFAGPDNERSTSFPGFFVGFGSRINKRLRINGETSYEKGALDFDFGAGPKFPRASAAALANPNAPLDPGPGDYLNMELSVNYQPTSALQMTLNYNRNRLRRYDTNRVAFDANLVSLRATYQFTRSLFTRARIDYDSISSSMRGQFLFGWAPSPGTALYIGYNDDARYNGFSPFSKHLEQGYRRDGRAFFIKMSYLFRKSL